MKRARVLEWPPGLRDLMLHLRDEVRACLHVRKRAAHNRQRHINDGADGQMNQYQGQDSICGRPGSNHYSLLGENARHHASLYGFRAIPRQQIARFHLRTGSAVHLRPTPPQYKADNSRSAWHTTPSRAESAALTTTLFFVYG